jgi:hypothetical protein
MQDLKEMRKNILHCLKNGLVAYVLLLDSIDTIDSVVITQCLLWVRHINRSRCIYCNHHFMGRKIKS